MPAAALNVTLCCSDCDAPLVTLWRAGQRREIEFLSRPDGGFARGMLTLHRTLAKECSASGLTVKVGWPRGDGPASTPPAPTGP